MINSFTSTGSVFTGVAGVSSGFAGTGVRNPVNVGTPAPLSSGMGGGFTSEAFGTSNHPFTTARADVSATIANNTLHYPYSAAGKLFFNIGNATYMCSASLLKRGIVVTAAHCVANFGKNQLYANWQFIPGYRNGFAPYGVWTASGVALLTSYYNGTDPCAVSGVVCTDDVAVIQLASQRETYAGTYTGYYGYGWNGWGFTPNGLTQITQIGYPAGLDNAALMERNDSYGYKAATLSNNTIIGSNMNGGSSGGPWVVNFGYASLPLTGETAGNYSLPNIIMGVTSWGYTNFDVKEQGASAFTSYNIVPILNVVCAGSNPRCL